MKQCTVCLLFKDLLDFKNHKETKDKKTNQCKCCLNKKQREYRLGNENILTAKYEKTHKGFLVRLYRNMKSRIDGIQKAKNHLYAGKELINKEDFYNFALSNKDYYELFKKYEESGFSRKLAPSVDRINSSLGYSIGNMEFVTMSENSSRGAKNKKILNEAKRTTQIAVL